MKTSTIEMYVLVSKNNSFLVRKEGEWKTGMSPFYLTPPYSFAESPVVMAWRRCALVSIKKEWNDFVRARCRSSAVRKSSLVQIKKIEVCLKEVK